MFQIRRLLYSVGASCARYLSSDVAIFRPMSRAQLAPTEYLDGQGFPPTRGYTLKLTPMIIVIYSSKMGRFNRE